MKNILIILLLLLAPISVYAGEAKVLEIGKNNLVFLNLWKKPEVRNLYESGKLTFDVIKGEKLQFVYKNKKIFLHLPGVNISEEGMIEVRFKNQKKQIAYKIDYNKNDENFDLKQDFLFKRLQKKPLSCESAAASDIITFLQGKIVDEDEVYNLLDKDKAGETAVWSGNKLIWGNPNKGFVGNVDYYGEEKIKPSQRLLTGYGVYEKPIEKVYKQYGLKTKIINNTDYNKYFTNNEHLSLLLKFLKKGKMVQLWGDWCTDPLYDEGPIGGNLITNSCPTLNNDRKIEWYYKEGSELKKHVGLRGEHSFYLLGYEGSIYKPEKIIVWDTDTGYHKYQTKEWMRKWDLMDNRSIIVGR
ncbi:hypothetical protein A9Q91_01625 [Candidatus Gracilibacteria bacterium 28_42_T64]|nr:hypothetical protein A9Q91_01625 [Candidatus Gracilibacteria bacterium 28_42_T64]